MCSAEFKHEYAVCVCVCVYIYIYIYVGINMHLCASCRYSLSEADDRLTSVK